MRYGLDNFVNNKVSDPVLFLFFDSFTGRYYTKKKENVVPKSFYFCTS